MFPSDKKPTIKTKNNTMFMVVGNLCSKGFENSNDLMDEIEKGVKLFDSNNKHVVNVKLSSIGKYTIHHV